jgi:hypothetical protein
MRAGPRTLALLFMAGSAGPGIFGASGAWMAGISLSGCAGRPEEAAARKPGAPVAVSLAARALGGDRYELVLHARAAGDIDNLVLELDLPAGVAYTGGGLVLPIGPASAGSAHQLVAEVRGPAGAWVVGGARLAAGAVHGAVASQAALGAAAAPKARRALATPLGPVTEVRQ